MTDREKLLTALLQEDERPAGWGFSVLDVVAMLETFVAARRTTDAGRTLTTA